MSKGTMTVIVVVAVVLTVAFTVGVMYMSCHNKEVGLRNAITAKQRDNTSEFDNMVKIICQTAQVTDAQKNALKEIFVEHAKARGGLGDGGVMKWLQESVPNVDTTIYNNLQNIIVASRGRWTERQKELLDLKREHDNVLDKVPSNWFVGGRSRIEVVIISSERTEKAFQTGKDDNVDVFKK